MTSIVPTLPAISRSVHRRTRPFSVFTVAFIAAGLILSSTLLGLWAILATP